MTPTTQLLKSLQSSSGLFIASPVEKTGYNKAWLRDNLYTSLGIELINPLEALNIVHKLLDILRKHEYKIDFAIKSKPDATFKYIHARYNPETLEEFWEEWGNKQNDAIGFLLFRIADLMQKDFHVLRDEQDNSIVQKLISYLDSVQYWHDKDNGIWEENEEVHASSVGACLAGLTAIARYIPVPSHLIAFGKVALDALLPKESATKNVDLALLSLIYPFNIVSELEAKQILENVEKNLVRNKGIIRYKGDKYYQNENGEAEWTMGFPWLATIYKSLGNKEKFSYYIKKTLEVMNEKGELPELYFADSNEHNANSPLGWAQSLYLVAVM